MADVFDGTTTMCFRRGGLVGIMDTLCTWLCCIHETFTCVKAPVRHGMRQRVGGRDGGMYEIVPSRTFLLSEVGRMRPEARMRGIATILPTLALSLSQPSSCSRRVFFASRHVLGGVWTGARRSILGL
jgi:hypothetical protein